VAITAALSRHRKREKNDGGIDVEMNGPLHPLLALPVPRVISAPLRDLGRQCVADLLFRLSAGKLLPSPRARARRDVNRGEKITPRHKPISGGKLLAGGNERINI